MGTYLVPRDLKGEGRILFFSYKALLYTVIGAVIGYVFYFVLNLIGARNSRNCYTLYFCFNWILYRSIKNA